MPDPFDKVAAGDALDIPAKFYNLVVDAVRDYLRRTQDGRGGATDLERDGLVISVKNATGTDLQAYTVVALGDVVIDPADSLDGFRTRPILEGNVPTADDLGRFAIFPTPVAADTVADGIIAGLAVVQVDDGDGSADFADVVDGSADSLEMNAGGSARVLWRAAGTGLQWAVVALRGAAGLPPAQYQGMVLQNVVDGRWGADYVPAVEALT